MVDQAKVTRIRRTAELPYFAQDERRRRSKYPYTLKIEGTVATVKYRVSRPYSVGDYTDAVIKTEVFGWIYIGRRRIGALALNEYDPNGCATNDEFWNVMDADSADEEALAVVLGNAWCHVVDDVTHAGPILEFRIAWIAPEHARGDLFAAASLGIIDKVCDHYSILVMRANSLEYHEYRGPPLTKAARSRQQAMIRYYGRIFGVRPFHGHDGKEGWLWRPNPRLIDLIEEPRRARTPASANIF